MKTIIKVPTYLEVETEAIDRRLITDQARLLLSPHIIKYLHSAEFKDSVLDKYRKAIGQKSAKVRIVSELELLSGKETEVKDNNDLL